jgi:DNA recombination protein RmuC
VIIFSLLKKKGGYSDEKLIAMMERLGLLQEQNKDLRLEIDKKLSETHQSNQFQFSQSAKLISDVTEKLTKLDETNKQIVDFSGQLKNLQDILKNPKQRGVLGEYYLEETLRNVLPPNSYQIQYPFKNGDIVDAVVFVKDKIIPVDSKFSLENYERILNAKDSEEREKLEKVFKQDLKNRIDETSKYVRPSEGTLDFAFMFIPSEAIYYDLLVNKVGAVKVDTRDLIEYAFRDRKVIIVSPTSFLAYLQTVLQGLKAMKIEESAQEIKKNVEKLGKHLIAYESYLQRTGKSLGATVNSYNSAYQEFKKIDKDVAKISETASGVEVLEIEKPKSED